MKRLFAVLIVFSLFCFTALADLREDEIPVFSADDYLTDEYEMIDVFSLENSIPSAILIESDSGQMLFEHNPDEKLPIASVTKVMTMLLCVEALDDGRIKLDDTVTVSEYAASMGGSQAFMEPGERMSVHDMMKAIAVSSCNDAAVAMAEFIAGSESAFVDKMNERAAALGMTSTEFVNCSGLDDREMHFSSARDVALMSRELLSHPIIFDYTTIWTDSIRSGGFGLANTNKLIRFYDGANGLKTGSTSKARYCLSASAKRNDMQLIAVVLGAPTSAERFAAARSLLDYGFANFASYKTKSNEAIEVKVRDGKLDKLKCRVQGKALLLNKSDVGKVEERLEMPEFVKAPVKKGDCIGKIIYTMDGKNIAQSDIVAENDIPQADYLYRLIELMRRVFK